MIILFRGTHDEDVDDNGVQIQKKILAPPPNSPPYCQPALPQYRIPSLSWICLTRLMMYYDQLAGLNVQFYYLPERSDVLKFPQPIDPRLWATISQLYDSLPDDWLEYELPLSDPHVPLFQRIPYSSQFGLVTLLDLPGCVHLCDETAPALSALHSLVALDGSSTALTPYGIKTLAASLLWVDDSSERRGLWHLRILRLRNCRDMGNEVYQHLTHFPLLSVVDLQGTKCRPSNKLPFRSSTAWVFFHPMPLNAAVDALRELDHHTFNVENLGKLFVRRLNHPTKYARPKEHTATAWSFLSSSRSNSSQMIPIVTDGSAIPSNPVAALLARLPGLHPRNFYSSPLVPTSPLGHPFGGGPTGSYNRYHAKNHYAGTNPSGAVVSLSSNDPGLALFRPPPPLSYLEEHCRGLLESRSQHRTASNQLGTDTSFGSASIDRSRLSKVPGLNQDRINGLRDNARRQSVPSVPSFPKRPNPSRNPFKRHSLDAALSTSIGSTSTKASRGTFASHVPANPKPFKPISTIEVPILPESASSATSKQRVQAPKVATESPVPHSPHVQTSNEDSITRKNSGPKKRPRIVEKPFESTKKTTRTVSSKESVSSTQPASFDWKAWSRKPG